MTHDPHRGRGVPPPLPTPADLRAVKDAVSSMILVYGHPFVNSRLATAVDVIEDAARYAEKAACLQR